MKKVIILIIMFLVFGLILSSSFVLAQGEDDENDNINYDTSCERNNDCKLDVPSKLAECLECDPYGCLIYESSDELVVAINKDWTPNCNIEQPDVCAACIGGVSGDDYEAKCVENQCIKIADIDDEDDDDEDGEDDENGEDDEDDDEIGEDSMESVTICHIPPGNPSAKHTIEVGAPAIRAHLAHDDILGTCEEPITEIEEELEIEVEEDEETNKTKLKVRLSNQERRELKILPEQAAERAKEILKVIKLEKIELKEKIYKNIPKVIYNIEAEKPGRFLGIFRFAMKVSTEIDSETGEVIKTSKPWWAFLVYEIGEEPSA